jgi:adenine phosphoribosyltransferase
MAVTPAHHTLVIGALTRELPVVRVAPGQAIAVLNILGDTELVEEAARLLHERVVTRGFDVIATPEAKSIPLAHALARLAKCPYVVFRKSHKLYMGEALSVTTRSITAQKEQTLYLDARDRATMAGRSVLLVDDVVSTGSTLEAMERLVALAGGRVVGVAAVCTEGEAGREPVIALAHLPLFRESPA